MNVFPVEKVYAWIKVTPIPGRAETSELGGMEGFTWTTWNCSLNCGSHGNLKPTHMFSPGGITEDVSLHFSLSLSESLGETRSAFLKGSLWHLHVCLALTDGEEAPNLTEEVRLGCETLLKYELRADGSQLPDCKITKFFFKRRKKRLVKASLYTLCF